MFTMRGRATKRLSIFHRNLRGRLANFQGRTRAIPEMMVWLKVQLDKQGSRWSCSVAVCKLQGQTSGGAGGGCRVFNDYRLTQPLLHFWCENACRDVR